ncbi:MAG TPA: hypothetical protein DD735_04450 [Clostridiales bacterium]|nr:hypothetical protein [Clostridiales bacterium]
MMRGLRNKEPNVLKNRIFALILVLLLFTGATPAFAGEAGGPNDPLVSLSYAKTWAQTVLDSAVPSISATLNPFYKKAAANAVASLSAGAGSSLVSLSSGGAIKITTGSSVTLVSGSAALSVSSGAVVNVSVGAQAGSGKLNQYQRYIACENTSATVTAGAASTFIVDGTYTKTDAPSVFTDVLASDWFYSDVYNAVDMGLINGMSATRFEPDGKLTLAQAVKLAACMHQLYHDGAVTLENGDPWYQPYLDYAEEKGVISDLYASLSAQQCNAEITRREYIYIFYNALPESEYSQINTVADNAIPDLIISDEHAAEIYAFYRAGILTGSGDSATMNWFLPDTHIARREVAAVLTRMFDASARRTVTIS